MRLYDRLFSHPVPGKRTAHEATGPAPEDDEGKSHARESTTDHDWLDNINPNSKQVINAYLEPELQDAQAEVQCQFERHCYFVADRFDSKPGKPVFNRTVTLRDSWGKGSG